MATQLNFDSGTSTTETLSGTSYSITEGSSAVADLTFTRPGATIENDSNAGNQYLHFSILNVEHMQSVGQNSFIGCYSTGIFHNLGTIDIDGGGGGISDSTGMAIVANLIVGGMYFIHNGADMTPDGVVASAAFEIGNNARLNIEQGQQFLGQIDVTSPNFIVELQAR